MLYPEGSVLQVRPERRDYVRANAVLYPERSVLYPIDAVPTEVVMVVEVVDGWMTDGC